MSRLGVFAIIACLALSSIHVVLANTTTEDREMLLKIHNDNRARMPATVMPALVWDNTLEAVAQAHANRCDYTSSFDIMGEYRNRGGNNFTSLSLQIAVSVNSGSEPTTLNAVFVWLDQESFWTYPTTCQVNKTCSAWTQIIWANTSSVGCGVKSCPGIVDGYDYGRVLSCLYGPAGNRPGQVPYIAAAVPSAAPHTIPSPASVPAITPTTPSTPASTPSSSPSTTSPVFVTPSNIPSPLSFPVAFPPTGIEVPVADTPAVISEPSAPVNDTPITVNPTVVVITPTEPNTTIPDLAPGVVPVFTPEGVIAPEPTSAATQVAPFAIVLVASLLLQL